MDPWLKLEFAWHPSQTDLISRPTLNVNSSLWGLPHLETVAKARSRRSQEVTQVLGNVSGRMSNGQQVQRNKLVQSSTVVLCTTVLCYLSKLKIQVKDLYPTVLRPQTWQHCVLLVEAHGGHLNGSHFFNSFELRNSSTAATSSSNSPVSKSTPSKIQMRVNVLPSRGAYYHWFIQSLEEGFAHPPSEIENWMSQKCWKGIGIYHCLS